LRQAVRDGSDDGECHKGKSCEDEMFHVGVCVRVRGMTNGREPFVYAIIIRLDS
jgi:hypothetical protein